MDTGTTTSSRPPGNQETDENRKKKAHLRYQDAVLALSKAFALAAASDEARQIRDEVGFFQTIRAALVKSSSKPGRSAAEREFTVQQIIDRAVVSTEIVDILGSAGLSSPDISILSEDLLSRLIMVFKLLPQCTRLEISKKLLYLDRAILGKNSILPIGIGCTRR